MAAQEKRRAALIQHFHLSFYKGTIGISALGTYYTFLLVAQPDPLSDFRANNKIFTPHSSRTLIAVAWLLFLLSLGLSTAALLSFSFRYAARTSYQASAADNASAIVPNFYGSHKNEAGLRQEETWMTITSGVIFSVVLVAFLLASLAVVAYMPAVGIIGAAFIAIFMLVSLAVWIRQLVQNARSRKSSAMLDTRRTSRLGPDLEAGLWNMMTAGGSVPIATQQPTNAPTTGANVTTAGRAGTVNSTRPSTRRHQPIIIRDPRADSSTMSTP